MNSGFFDVHAHLTSPAFAGDLNQVLARARTDGLTTIVSNGLNRSDNQRVLALAASEPIVRPALGFYPVDAVLPEMLALGHEYPRDDTESATAEETLVWIGDNLGRAVALGEVGLDHHWVPEALWERQEAVLRGLLQVALDHDKPVILHSRKAEARTLEILQELGVRRANWHCFSSRLKLARKIAEYGHFLSVPANARRSETFTALLRDLPRSQLLLETDCPYLPAIPGERNEPSGVVNTVHYAAELWDTSEPEALAIFRENFERLFRFAP
jgi:TatD DNase family protein